MLKLLQLLNSLLPEPEPFIINVRGYRFLVDRDGNTHRLDFPPGPGKEFEQFVKEQRKK